MEDEESEALVGEEDQPLPTQLLEVETNVGGGGRYEKESDGHFVNNKPGGGNTLQQPESQNKLFLWRPLTNLPGLSH